MDKSIREKMRGRGDLLLAQLNSDLSYHFHTMKEHFESIQALLADEANKIGVHTQQEIKSTNPEFIDDSIWEDFDKYKNNFPDSQRNAFFVMAYAELELTLVHVCATVLDLLKDKLTVRPTEWFGSILGRTKTLFNKEGISLNEHLEIWEEIDQLRVLRNKIVHSGGWFSKDRDASLYAYLITKNNIRLKDWNEQHLYYKPQFSDDFIFYAFTLFDNFLSILNSCIYSWWKTRQ